MKKFTIWRLGEAHGEKDKEIIRQWKNNVIFLVQSLLFVLPLPLYSASYKEVCFYTLLTGPLFLLQFLSFMIRIADDIRDFKVAEIKKNNQSIFHSHLVQGGQDPVPLSRSEGYHPRR